MADIDIIVTNTGSVELEAARVRLAGPFILSSVL